MKSNVIVLFIALSVSQLHAGSFTFDKITTPAKKACDDIACVVAKHPGSIAVTALLSGCLLIDVQHKRKRALENEEKDWDSWLLEQLHPDTKNAPDHKSRREKEMQRRLKVGAEIEQGIKELAAGKMDSEEILTDIKEKTKHLTESPVKKAINECLNKTNKVRVSVEQPNGTYTKHYEDSPLPPDDEELLFIRSYFNEKQQFADKKAQHKFLIDAGVLIALMSIGCGIYKAYPQLIKWFSPSVK